MRLRNIARGGFALPTRLKLFVILVLVVGIASTVSAQPTSFDLIGPGTADAPGPNVTDPSSVTEIQWERLNGTVEYTFELTYPDGEVLTIDALTPTHDEDTLDCFNQEAICYFTVAGEAVLTQNGAYSWTVIATDADGVDTEAGNAPFFFTVNVDDLPGEFDLIRPGSATAPGPEVTDPSAVTQIQWEESAGADTYTFELTFPDDSVVALADLNDGNELACAAGICTFTVAGETVLTQNGAYSWTVFAFNADGSTEAGNAPFFFTVNTASLPSAFSLVFPSDGAVFTEALPAQTPIEWGLSSGADTYRWVLQKVSTNTRLDIGTIVDAGDLNDGDELTCDADSCVFVVDASVLDSGQYSWTVFATNADGTVEAVNGPYTFTVNLEADSGLVTNGSFEAEGQWTFNDGVKVKCSTSKQIGYTGNCALTLRDAGKAAQTIDTALFNNGAALTLSAWVEGKNAVDGASIRIKIKYADDTKAKARLNVPAGSYAYQPLTDTVTISGTVTKAKVIIRTVGAGGRVRIDDVTLLEGGAGAVLPLPAVK